MFYKSLNINNSEYKLAVNLTGSGAPTEGTEANVGMFYMDENTGKVYKKTASGWSEFGGSGTNRKDGLSTWVASVEFGPWPETTISHADIVNIINEDREVQLNDLILYTDGKIGYVVDVYGDAITTLDTKIDLSGKDYVLTEADKAEIVSTLSDISVLKNQGAENVGKILVVGTDGNLVLMNIPEGGASGDVTGVLDGNNNIILSGNLSDGTYTLKYENDDGTYTEVGKLEVGEIIPEPTNLFIIGGDGYILNGRCNSEGKDRTDTNGNIVTNYIDVKNGDTVYIKNATLQNSSTTGSYSCMKLTDSSVVGFYPDTTEHITNLSTSNGVTQFTVNNENADYIRLCLNISYGTATTNDIVAGKGIIITVNEPLS